MRATSARRGELQSVGEIISAVLEAAGTDPRFYRPWPTVSQANSDKQAAEQRREITLVQLELNFNK